MNKQINKIALRPIIPTIKENKLQSVEETLQNEALRPILKLQNDLIFSFFNNYLKEKKIEFKTLNQLKKHARIEKIFNQDNAFKIELKGLILGLLTVEEYEKYNESKKGFNKRIYTMAKERISSWY